MTPKQLKSSILQYAIQGKLVEQRAEEGTGEELYKKIQAEKQRLLKEGKIKKEKILPEISEDEVPFDIPESWKWVRLGNIIQLSKGEKKENIKYKYLEARYLRGNISPRIYCEGEYVPKGTNVILVDGENSGEVFELKEEGYLGSTFKILSIPASMDRKYIINFLEYKKKELRENKKGAAIPHLNKELLFNYPLPIPPLDEQKRVVNKIEELLPYVEKYALNYEKLEKLNAGFPDDMKKSILQYAIQGKLVEQRTEEGTGEELYKKIQAEKQKLINERKIKKEKVLPEINDDEIPFDIPDSWKWCRMSDIMDVRDGTHDSPKFVPEGIPLVTSKNLKQGTIDFDNVKYISHLDAKKINNRSEVVNDDILLAMIGSIGNPVLVRKDREFCIKNIALFKRYSQSDLLMQYIYWFLYYAQYKLKREALGGVQSFVSLSLLREYIIPLPPLAEQKRIVKKIEELLPYTDR